MMASSAARNAQQQLRRPRAAAPQRGARRCCRCRATAPERPRRPSAAAAALHHAEERRCAAAALASLLLLLLPAEPTQAALLAPNARLPRTAEAALRRAVPVVHGPTGELQRSLEDVASRLRIPQRKPWDTMRASVDALAARLADPASAAAVVDAAPAARRPAAAADVAALRLQLAGVAQALAAQDADATSTRVAAALRSVSRLEVAQCAGLPYALPAAYADRPRLVGRATVELRIARPGGATFAAAGDGEGQKNEARVTLTLDGFNAPLTAGNYAARVARGDYDGAVLAGSEADEAVFARPPGDRGAAAPRPLLPLEVRATTSFEPQYRAPLDVPTELPALPMSVFGSAAMARGANGNDSDPGAFFLYRYNRATAGLGGLAFEEGTYAVFGYVTDGAEAVRQLRSGDRIVSARLVSGEDGLVVPQQQRAGGGGRARAGDDAAPAEVAAAAGDESLPEL